MNYEYNVVNVTKSSSLITEDFANLTNKPTSCVSNGTIIGSPDYTPEDEFTGNSNVTWSYKGFACAPYYTKDVNSKGIGIGQRSANKNFITASGFTGGVGEIVVTYKFANPNNSATLQVFVNNSETAAASASISGSRQDSATGFGTATLAVNDATAASFTLKATKSSNDTFVITSVTWDGV